MSTPDHSDWNSPAAIASYIANGVPSGTPGGVPLLSNADTIADGTLSAVAIGASQSVGPLDVLQLGYLCYFAVQDHTSTTAGSAVKIQFDWSDSVSGQIVLTESWVVAAGPNGTPHQLKGRGPSAANQVQITVFNASISGDAVDCTYLLMEDSRLYTRSDLRTSVLAGAGYTLPTTGMDQDVLGTMSPGGLASGGEWTRLLPLYTGTVGIYGQTASGTSDGEFQITGVVAAFAMAAQSLLMDTFTDSHGLLNTSVALPRFQCSISAINHNAGSRALAATVVVAEQET